MSLAKRASLCALFTLLGVAGISTVRAEVPRKLNFQAILLEEDGTVVPDGTYNLTFRIYSDSSGGTALWEETQALTTEKGLFNTYIGANDPVPDEVFAGPSRWMEIQLVENPTPYEPRTQIASVAYSFRVSTVDGATGGTITGDVRLESTFFAEQIDVGDISRSGMLRLFEEGWATPILQATHNTDGASVTAADESGNAVARVEADVNGDGGYLAVYRSPADAGFIVDGNHDGSGEPQVAISGSARTASFDMGQSGDASVAFPFDAMSAPEILDEPGLAQGRHAGDIVVTGAAAMMDIVTCSITIPAPGYIVVEATAQTRFYTTGVNKSNYMDCQIDETAGGPSDANHAFRIGIGAAPTVSNSWWPISMKRTYYKASAGTYTFRFEALDGSLEGDKFMWNPVITATYLPTSYGTVATYVSAADAGAYPGATMETIQGDNVTLDPVTRTAYRVDLSELEASVSLLREQLRQAEADLLKAQLEAQTSAAAVDDQ